MTQIIIHPTTNEPIAPKKDRRLRILWSSNHPLSPSGYSQQQAYILPRLVADGWSQAHSNFFGQEGYVHEWEGVLHYPKISSLWGDDAMVNHAIDFKADITITNQDIWTLNPEALAQVKRFIPWLPVDHDPIPPEVLARAKMAYRVIAYSRFAEKQLSEKGVHSTYIPCMVDTKIFKPYKKSEIRDALGIPQDAFLFGMVAANKDIPPRKSFQQVLDAFKLFHDKHPKAKLYLHVAVDNPGGFPIRAYAKYLGFEGEIHYPPGYDLMYKVTKEDMAKIYSAMDVLLAPSSSEGFGVPIIEAQSCGTPVIANDFTAMTELIQPGETGYLTKIASKRFTPLLSYVSDPDTKDLYDKMEQLFKDDRKKMGMLARLSMMQYDADYVVNSHWIPFLEKVQGEVFENQPE